MHCAMYMLVTKDGKATNETATSQEPCGNWGTCRSYVVKNNCDQGGTGKGNQCRKVRLLAWVQHPATGTMLPFYDTERRYSGTTKRDLTGNVVQEAFKNVFNEPSLIFDDPGSGNLQNRKLLQCTM